MPDQHEWVNAEISRLLATLGELGVKVDAVLPDGTHLYWSTHCRCNPNGHDGCSAKWMEGPTVMDGVTTSIARRPAQCKTCASPCICPCHEGADGG